MKSFIKLRDTVSDIVFNGVAGIVVLGCAVIGWVLGWGLHMNFAAEPGVVLFFGAGLIIVAVGAGREGDFPVLGYVFAACLAAGFIGGWWVVVVAYWLLVLAVVTSPVWGAWLLYRRRRNRLLH